MSTNSGQTSSDINPSNVRLLAHSTRTPLVHHLNLHKRTANLDVQQIKWTQQDESVLQSYRRAYRIDTPSTFKNPLSHVVLGGQGIGRFSPTMARPKSQRRVHKDQLALAVRKHFNGLGVSENEVIVDWLYKTKNQGKLIRSRHSDTLLITIQIKNFEHGSRLNANDTNTTYTRSFSYLLRCTFGVLLRYPIRHI